MSTTQAAEFAQPVYVTGGRVVVTTPGETGGVALAASVRPDGSTLAEVSLANAAGLVVRNQTYAGTALQSEQLPLQVTRAGRVAVNAPGVLSDSDVRIVDHEMTVFGGLSADRLSCVSLDVQQIESLNLTYVKGVANVNEQIVVTHEDNTTSQLTIDWNTIQNKPTSFPSDPTVAESIPYLTNRVQLAQANVDFLLAQLAALQTKLDSLGRQTVSAPGTFPPPASTAGNLQSASRAAVAAGLAAVRTALQ